jgi:hypothetical protein
MSGLKPGTKIEHSVHGKGVVQDVRDKNGWVLVVFENAKLWMDDNEVEHD